MCSCISQLTYHVTVMMLSMFCGHVPRGYIQFLPRVLHFSAVHLVSSSSRPFTPQKTGNTSVHYIGPHGGKWPFLFLVISTNNCWNSCGMRVLPHTTRMWEYTHSTGIPTVVCNSLSLTHTHTHCYLYCYLHTCPPTNTSGINIDIDEAKQKPIVNQALGISNSYYFTAY